MAVVREAVVALTCLTLLSFVGCDMDAAAEGAADNETNRFWTYDMQTGRDGWAARFPACGEKNQSPADLTRDMKKNKAALGRLTFTNFNTTKNVQWYLTNDGHAAKVAYESGNPMLSDGGLARHYKVAQFHFHWGSEDSKGSEHTLNGKQFPVEMHIVAHSVVYKDVVSALGKENGLAVVGVFFKVRKEDDDDDDETAEDQTHNALQSLVSKFKDIEQPGLNVSLEVFPLEVLLPKNTKNYYRYIGSLTTPPCSGMVTWTVLRRPVRISEAQLTEFRTRLLSVELKRLVDNFRFTQPLDGRKVIHNKRPKSGRNAQPFPV